MKNNNDNNELLTEAEVDLYIWQMSTQSSFKNKLFDLIAKADNSNASKIAKGFPEHVECYKRYSTEEGYWDSVQEKYNKGL